MVALFFVHFSTHWFTADSYGFGFSIFTYSTHWFFRSPGWAYWGLTLRTTGRYPPSSATRTGHHPWWPPVESRRWRCSHTLRPVLVEFQRRSPSALGQWFLPGIATTWSVPEVYPHWPCRTSRFSYFLLYCLDLVQERYMDSLLVL